jgi:hypothetical protein
MYITYSILIDILQRKRPELSRELFWSDDEEEEEEKKEDEEVVEEEFVTDGSRLVEMSSKVKLRYIKYVYLYNILYT